MSKEAFNADQNPGLPRDKRGIRWSKLANDPERLALAIESEVQKLCTGGKELTDNNLRKEGMGSLAHAIGRYYPGKLSGLKEKLGISTDARARGYWINNDCQAIEEEAQGFQQQVGKLSFTLLEQHGRTDLALAIRRQYPGGIRKLQQKLRLPELHKSRGYWTSERIEIEANSFYGREGTLSHSALKGKKKGNLSGAILKYYPGGVTALRQKLGISEKKEHKQGYWQNQLTIEHEASKILSQGVNLNHSDLRRTGFSSLSSAISSHYPGGIRALREKLGIVPKPEIQVSPDQANEELMKLLEPKE